MKRLRDIVDHEGGLRGDPLFRRGVELLQGTPPTAAGADAKLRVWRAIGRAATPARRGRTVLLRFAVAAAVALVAGTAGAVIAGRWIAPRLEPDAAPAPAASVTRARHPPRTETVAGPAAADAATDDGAARPIARTAERSPAKKLAAGASASAAAVARERSEVLDALVALRRAHDPVRAGALVARYLAAHPHGELREEALVLAIEAADARGDRTAGAQLARAYQDEFPAGRFALFARRHTAPEKDPTH